MNFFGRKKTEDFEPIFYLKSGINDTKEDFDIFLKNAAEKNISIVKIELDENTSDIYGNIFSEDIIKILDYAFMETMKNGINLELSEQLKDITDKYNSKNGNFLPENPIKDKYLGCEEFLHTISFTLSGIRHCMKMLPENSPPVIPVTAEYVPSADEIINIKNNIEEQRRCGNLQYDCENCEKIRFSAHNNQPYINKILIAHKNDCNADCTFCYNKLNDEKQVNYNIMDCLKNIKPLLKYGFELYFGGGEPTVWEEFDEICQFAVDEKAKFMVISTNGLVFSEKLANLLESGIAHIIFTTDTANKETYKKIKNADYDKVIANMKKYMMYDKFNHIQNKFIILPQINDSKNEITEWIDSSVKIGIKNLDIDVESTFFFQNRFHIPRKITKLVKFAKKTIEKNNCKLHLHSFAAQLLYDEENKK